MQITMVGENNSSFELHPCSICGRTFLQNSLEKHMVICQKIKSKKRKVFDSSKQRQEAIDVKIKKPEKPKSEKSIATSKKSNWREKHDQFLKNIRAAKAVDKAIKNGEELPPVEKSSVPSDYTQCPHCERHFSEKAAERHINWCQTQKQKKNESKSVEASQRLKARIKYQAPPPGRKTSKSEEPPTSRKVKENVDSAEIRRKSLGLPQKSAKAKSSPPVISRSSKSMKSVNLSNSMNRGSEKKSSQNKPAKIVHHAKELFPSNGSQSKIISLNLEKLPAKTSFDDLVLENSFHRGTIRCSKPFGTMAPRTVPGVRTNSKINKNSLNSSFANKSAYYDSYSPSSYKRLADVMGLDEDEIDEIDLSRNNGGHIGRNTSPRRQQNGFRHSGAFSSNKRSFSHHGLNKLGSDSDNRGSTSGSDSSLPPLSIPNGSGELYRLPRFCHECGTKYPIANAKYCCECGIRRVCIESSTS